MPQILDFITPTVLRVLEFFFGHPAAEFHEREVMRAAGVSKGSANRILRRLAELALLTRVEKGRMVFYRLNAADPFTRQLKIAVNVWALRPFVDGLKGTARKVLLFGSCAEGTDVSESDIDVVILTADKRTAKENVSAFNRKAARQIAPIIVDMKEFARMRKDDRALFERIDRGIALWEMA
jgi:predicted nucleotidyltransferase